MKKLSKEAEAKILDALTKVAQLVSEVPDPNDAIIKVARDCSFPAGYVNMMVHAYNTGRTTRQREDGGDLFDKSADFKLAEPSIILEALFPSQVKTAAQVQRETYVSAEYSQAPLFLQRKYAQEDRQKVAGDVDWRKWSQGRYVDEHGEEQELIVEASAPEPYPADQDFANRREAAELQKTAQTVERIRGELSATLDGVRAKFAALDEYFRRPGCEPFSSVRENAELMFGKEGAAVMNQLVRQHPVLEKQAGRCCAVADTHQAPYSEIRSIVTAVPVLQQQKQAYEELTKTAQEDQDAFYRPFGEACRTGSIMAECSVSAQPTEKQAIGMGGGLMGGLIGKEMLRGMATNTALSGPTMESELPNLMSAPHEADLRRIQTQAMLNDLMTNDPVIAGHEPELVLDAFNQISQMAPRSTNQRMLMQTLLRKHLEQGHLDPFEIDQLLGMENKIQDRDEPKTMDPTSSVAAIS